MLIVILTGVIIEIVILYVPKFYDFYQNNYSGETTSSDNNNFPLDQFDKVVETITQPPSPNGFSIRSSIAPMINKITPSQVAPVKIFSYKDIHTNKSEVNFTFIPKSPHPRKSHQSGIFGSNSNSRPSTSKSRKTSSKIDYALHSQPSLAQIQVTRQIQFDEVSPQNTSEEKKEPCYAPEILKSVGSGSSFSD